MLNALILFSLLTILLLFFYKKSEHFYFASVIACGSFWLCSLGLCFIIYDLKVSISLITVITIIAALLSLFFGERFSICFFSSKLVFSHPVQKGKPLSDAAGKGKKINCRFTSFFSNVGEYKRIDFNVFILICVCFLCLLTLILYIFDDLRIVRDYSGSLPSGILHIYSILREAKNAGFANSSLVSFLLLVSEVSSFCCLYPFLFNLSCSSFKKKDLFLLLPEILYFGICILTSGRTSIEQAIISIAILYIILISQSSKNKKEALLKSIFVLAIAAVIFAAFFMILGFSRGATIKQENQFFMFAFYAGSPIASFDWYLNNPFQNVTGWFGYHCFYGLYSFLAKFNHSIPSISMPLDVVYFNGFGTNIYTSLRRYIQDFGPAGALIMPFCMGLIYGIIEGKTLGKKVSIPLSALISYFAYPLCEFAIEERFFNTYFSTGFVYLCLIFAAFYYFLIKTQLFYHFIPTSQGEGKMVIRQSALKGEVYHRNLSKTDINAIIIAFNPDIKRLFEAVSSVSKQVDELFIFDNGSANFEEYSDLISRSFDNVVFFKSSENNGISIPLNEGVALSNSRLYKWSLLLDQDSVFPTDAIGSYLNVANADKNDDIAIICPHIYYRNIPDLTRKTTCTVIDVDSCITSGSLINVKKAIQCGLFDERYFIDYVDLDFAKKIRRLNFRIVRVDSVILNHDLGDAHLFRLPFRNILFFTKPLFREYYIIRNGFDFLSKNYTGLAFFRASFSFAFSLLLSFLHSRDKKQWYQTFALAKKDFQTNRFGKKESLP